MSFYINSLKYERSKVQDPGFVDRKHIRQRQWDETSQTFEETQGNAFTLERLMPVPYTLGLSLDIWTTSTNMKLQLIEQLVTLFNPSLEIQSTDNYLDWTSLSTIELDDLNWSSRSVPNNNDSIDIATLKFSLPIWISPPAKITKEGVIHKVIAGIYDRTGVFIDAINQDDILLGTRVKITPHGYQVFLLGNELRILPQTDPGDSGAIDYVPSPADNDISWKAVIDEYGVINGGISQVRFESAIDGESDIIGTVAYHPADDGVLLFTVDPDTLNSNTLSPIDAVIDPLTSGPGIGLPLAVSGQRYLLVESTGSASDTGVAAAWNGSIELVAVANDIIEFNGTNWVVALNSADVLANQPEYVTNLKTNIQFKFINGQWKRSFEGIYAGGQWSVVL
jgi:hypothetical protein